MFLKYRVCKTCAVSFQRPGYSKNFCSILCANQSAHKIKRCLPKCAKKTLAIRTTKFRDGSQHSQLFCSLCLWVEYAPKRDESESIGLQQVKLQRAFGESFYTSRDWLSLRYKALVTHGRACMACGASDRLHVDHIKPRSKYPELELDLSNLQVLCRECNLGKGADDETDWR